MCLCLRHKTRLSWFLTVIAKQAFNKKFIHKPIFAFKTSVASRKRFKINLLQLGFRNYIILTKELYTLFRSRPASNQHRGHFSVPVEIVYFFTMLIRT